MSAAPPPKRASRPATPILNAWRRLTRRRYGDPVPAEAMSNEVGSPLWLAAAWEQSALTAWQQGSSAETVAEDLVEPYRQYAAAFTHRTYRHAVHLTDRQLAALERVMQARSLSVREKLAVLKLAETEAVNLHVYRAYEHRHPWHKAKERWLRARRRATA